MTDTSRRIFIGMVGGGRAGKIGATHRLAARLDDRFDLVAGAFSADPDASRAFGLSLGLAKDRCYGDFRAMARREARRDDGIKAVVIVTPNHLHVPVAEAFLKQGIHVICDKPLATSLRQARRLEAVLARSGCLFVLTHTYTGYAMIRQARRMVADGALGTIRLLHVDYAQDWLAERIEARGDPQAAWRMDPRRSGPGGTIADIGTHAFNLAAFVSGLQAQSLSAELTSLVPGRRLDDNAHILLRYENGARGMVWASQVATGQANRLTLGLYGDQGGLEWSQEDPERLWFTPLGEPKRLILRGGPGTLPDAARFSHVPAGHPEGYLEAFGNLYSEAARAIRAALDGRPPEPDVIYPTIAAGIAGMEFIEACIRSSKRNGAWVRLG